jgi:hypothetical protein
VQNYWKQRQRRATVANAYQKHLATAQGGERVQTSVSRDERVIGHINMPAPNAPKTKFVKGVTGKRVKRVIYK